MLLRVLIDGCRSRRDLALENLVLRHQLESCFAASQSRSCATGTGSCGSGASALAGGMEKSAEDRATGDSDRLASQGLAPVLELEVAQSAGPATPEPGSPGADCSNVA